MKQPELVTYKGRQVKAVQVADGVFKRAGRKGATTFLIRCSKTNELCYCSVDRLDKLITRHGSIEAVGQKYLSREGKREIKQAEQDVNEQLETQTHSIPDPTSNQPAVVDNIEFDHDPESDLEIANEILDEIDFEDLDELANIEIE